MMFDNTESSWFDAASASFLAQADESMPVSPDQRGQESTAQDAAGNGGAGQQGTPPSPGLFNPLTIMLLVLVPSIVFSMMGQRKEKKKRQEMLGGMKKHDHVQTIGGVIGSIVSINNDHIVLKVDESTNTRIKFARSAVSQILPDGRKGAAQDVTPLEAPNS